MNFKIVVAVEEEKLGIGLHGIMPWQIPSETAYFRKVTESTTDPLKKNFLIIGRKTFESLGSKPFAGRITCILTKSALLTANSNDVFCCSSIPEALLKANSMKENIEQIFVCGGSTVYFEAVSHPQCEAIYLTRIYSKFESDSFFPQIDPKVFKFSHCSPEQVDSKTRIHWKVEIYVPSQTIPPPLGSLPWSPLKEHEEYQYLRLISDVISNGTKKESRAGPTISKFGAMMKFSLENGVLPLLTTKRVFWRGVSEELLWFISGNTSAKTLQQKNIHIWDANSTVEFLKKACPQRNEYIEGDLGPVYGFQWRHFGAEYQGMNAEYKGKGIDQLHEIIEMIKKDPQSRRIIMSSWNPVDLNKMALPPCHVLCQFIVEKSKYLSCLLYQRSADLGLGIPFNIASYSLLTFMIASITGLEPYQLVHVIGDAHVYCNHIEPLKEQLTRTPKPFPRLKINKKTDDIHSFQFEDFELIGYDPWPTIKMEMNA